MKKQRNNSEFPLGMGTFLLSAMMFQLIIYLFVYQTQSYTFNMFLLTIAIFLGSFIGFFFGVLAGFVYIGLFFLFAIGIAVFIPEAVNAFAYFVLFFVPFITIIAAYTHQSYQKEQKQLLALQKKAAQISVVDPLTELDTLQPLVDLLIKQSHLAKRYDHYTFSVAMVRIDFLETTRNILGQQSYQLLLREISQILKSEIRIEDYKFTVTEGTFVIVLPLTAKQHFQVVDERIKMRFDTIELFDRNHKKFKPTIKTGVIMYEPHKFEDFQKFEKIFLELQKQTEVDITPEY